MDENQEGSSAFQGTQEEKPFGCSECHKRFTRKGDMYRHLRTHTGEKPFSCPECADEFSRKDDMIRHFRTHTGVKPFACTMCDRKFSRRADLFKHVMTHPDAQVEQGLCSALGCQDSSHNHRHMQGALQRKRDRPKNAPGTVIHKCNLCLKTFNRKRDMTRHLRTHTLLEVVNISSNNSDTVITNKENESCYENVQVQVTNNDGELQKPCDNILQLNIADVPSFSECKFVIITDDMGTESVSSAIQLIINDPEVQNTILGGATKTNDKPFHCPQCGDKFGRKSDMVRHLQIHSGLKPFVCNLCGRPFSRKGDMNRHAMTHSGVKPYCCSVCFKSFARKSDFEIHSSVHTMDVCPVECQSTATISQVV